MLDINGPYTLVKISSPKYWTINQRMNHWMNQFKTKEIGFVYCPKCGKTLLNDNNFLQTHMLKHVNDRLINKEQKLYRFHPSLKPRFADTAYGVASNERLRNKSWG